MDTPAGTDLARPDPSCQPVGPAPTELVLWHSLANQAAGKLEELVVRYNEETTGPDVRAEQRGGVGEVLDALASSPLEQSPDVVLIDHKAARTLIDSDRFVPVEGCPATAAVVDQLLPIADVTYRQGEDLWALAFGASVPVLMYNETRVVAAGLDPADPPTTLAELSERSSVIVETQAAAYGLAVHDGFGPWFVQHFAARLGLPTAEPDNGRSGTILEVSFARPEIVQGIEWLVDEIESGRALWIGGNASGFDDILRLVAPDGAAYTISTSAAIGEVLRVLEAGSFPGAALGVAPLPGPGLSGSLLGGNALWNHNTGDSSSVSASADFVSWLMSPEQMAEFSAYTGYVPTVAGALEEPLLQSEWAVKPQLRVPYDQVAELPADDTWAGPLWGPGVSINSALYQALSAMVESGADPGTDLERVESQALELLAAYEAQVGG